jgi:hypothetical protein
MTPTSYLLTCSIALSPSQASFLAPLSHPPLLIVALLTHLAHPGPTTTTASTHLIPLACLLNHSSSSLPGSTHPPSCSAHASHYPTDGASRLSQPSPASTHSSVSPITSSSHPPTAAISIGWTQVAPTHLGLSYWCDSHALASHSSATSEPNLSPPTSPSPSHSSHISDSYHPNALLSHFSSHSQVQTPIT